MTVLHTHEGAEYFFIEGCFILEISNSALDPDVSIARARVSPGVTTRWHALNQTIERYFILSGAGLVDVGEAPPQEVLPGDVVLIRPGQRQRITNAGDCDLVFLAICSPRFESANYIDLAPLSSGEPIL